MADTHRIYLDNASSTPVHPRVARAVFHALEGLSGNPSAPHAEGRSAYEAMHDARKKIAESLSVKPDEMIFTSGGTEANNLALQGLIEALHERGIPYEKLHIVTTSIEHSSILETTELLKRRGVAITYVEPDFDGIVRPDHIAAALTPDTALVSVAHVNSEVGTIQPLSDIATEIKRWKDRKLSALDRHAPGASFPLFHADAAQSPLYLEASPHAFRADLVSYDAQKLCGPKGVGILWRDFSVPLAPLFGGGTQERGIRPGTENVAGIVGAGVAFELAHDDRKRRESRVTELRNHLIELVTQAVPDAELVGHPRRRIANNALFSIPGIDGDYLAVLMDERGISVSPRSACVGTGAGYSHVVKELTKDEARARGTIRFSLGPSTGRYEVERAVSALKEAVKIAKSGVQ